MFNKLHIRMGNWHSQFKQLLLDFLLWILYLMSDDLISVLQFFSECHFTHLIVNHGKLLHILVVLTDQMLLLLG